MFDQLDLVPAYGRDYKSKSALLADWLLGKDFQLVYSGQYTSVRDIQVIRDRGISSLNIRYDNMRKKLIINLEV